MKKMSLKEFAKIRTDKKGYALQLTYKDYCKAVDGLNEINSHPQEIIKLEEDEEIF